LKALTAISLAVGVLVSSLAQAATTSTQIPVGKGLQVTDLGLAPQNEVRQLTLSLAVRDLAAMEAYAASTVDPTSASFHKFLTPAQVGAQFGQDAISVAQVVNFLKAQGLNVTKVYSNNLFISVEGTNAQMAAVFGSPIHTFQSAGETYEAPADTTAVPTQLVGLVQGVHGLDTRPLAKSNAVRQPQAAVPFGEASSVPAKLPTPGATATDTPGAYTTADLANKYNINPLYKAGITGAGATVGIATMAPYSQEEAFTYWRAIGLNVSLNRITDVPVDGGPGTRYGPGSDGWIESSMDVQQAGGVAPGAKVRVYMAPNNGAGFLDMMATAVEENIVDTLSVSWGSPEIVNNGATLNAFHTVFLQAAIQGIPVIAATGDAGAYDINAGYAYPDCTTMLSVDFPAADPLVLGAGGTTLPHTQSKPYGSITIPAERAWAWDYMRNYFVQYYGQAFYYAHYFPIGGGGGVSVYFGRPSYQDNLAGVSNTAAGQSLRCKSINNYQELTNLRANFAGRNLPDVSLNADPYSGYLVYFGGMNAGYAGTSVVAPQLNGIFTLITAGRGSRLGFLHPQLYGAFKAQGYGVGSPFRAVTAGTDFFYSSKASYNPATGLGSLDVANLARTLGVRF
jgi:kumamolisin